MSSAFRGSFRTNRRRFSLQLRSIIAPRRYKLFVEIDQRGTATKTSPGLRVRGAYSDARIEDIRIFTHNVVWHHSP